MYEVIKRFKDTDEHIYEVGDMYPGMEQIPTEKRLKELSSESNKYNEPFITKIAGAGVVESVEVEPQSEPTEPEGGEHVEPKPEPPAKPKQPAKKKK